MSYPKKIVLNCSHTATLQTERLVLQHLVADLLRQGVQFIGVVGAECSRVGEFIDEIVVADGADCCILTASYPGQSVAFAIAAARCLTGDYAGDEVQVIELLPRGIDRSVTRH